MAAAVRPSAPEAGPLLTGWDAGGEGGLGVWRRTCCPASLTPTLGPVELTWRRP